MLPVVIGGVVAVAGFGTAIALAVGKSSAQNSANSVASQIVTNGGTEGACVNPTSRFANACSVLSSDDNKVNSDALIANIGLGVGIGATALTVLYFALASRGDSTPTTPATTATRPVVTPLVGKGLGGLAIGASF
jgi:hypothetical protein